MKNSKTIIEMAILVVCILIVLAFALTTHYQSSNCNKPYVLVNGICCLDENENNVCDNQEPVTGNQTTEQNQATPTTKPETIIFYLRDYPEIENMFRSTGLTLKSAIEQKGYNVTSIERSYDQKGGYDNLIKNYVFVAVEKRLTNETILEEGYKISEDIVPYMKSYYKDSVVWIVLVHDNCNSSAATNGYAVLCIFSIAEKNLGGCGLKQPTNSECYG